MYGSSARSFENSRHFDERAWAETKRQSLVLFLSLRDEHSRFRVRNATTDLRPLLTALRFPDSNSHPSPLILPLFPPNPLPLNFTAKLAQACRMTSP